MERKNLIKKGLAIMVITLFIGFAIAPSINANVSKENLVEFSTEICGLDGRRQTVKLTLEEAEEVEALFNSIREQLNSTDTREEAEEVFKEAVVELDKYDLLGGLSVKQAQRLVTGGFFNPKIIKLFEKLSNSNLGILDDNSNYLCLISGESDFTYFLSVILPRVRFLFPIPIMNRMLFGYKLKDPITGVIFRNPSTGWINTNGIQGTKNWNGTFWGDLPILRPTLGYTDFHYFLFKFINIFFNIFPDNTMIGTRYYGVSGFTGIKIFDFSRGNAHYNYFGFALRVRLTYEIPE